MSERPNESCQPPVEGFPSAIARAAHWGGLFAGPIAALLVYLLLGAGVSSGATGKAELTQAGLIVLSVGAWMAVWWVTEPVSSAVTSMLPLTIFPLVGVLGFKQAAAPYVDDLIVLFFAGFVLGQAVEKWGLHQRVALWTVRAFGTRPSMIVLGVMCATALVSMWVSNTATAVMMTPIALSLASMADRSRGPRWSEKSSRQFSVALLLGVSYAASIGGMGTPIGTPPNLQLVAYAKEVLGREISFASWMTIAVPIGVVALALAWMLIVFLHPTGARRLELERGAIRQQLRSLGPLPRAGWVVGVIFLFAAIAWVARVPVTDWLNHTLREEHAAAVADWQRAGAEPGREPPKWTKREFVGDAGIGLLAVLALFTVPIHRRRDSFVLGWNDCRALPWGTLLLFGGGLSLAAAMKASGAEVYLGSLFAHLQGLPTPVLLLLLAAGVVALSEVASNTALAAAIIPILGSAAPGLGIDPMKLLLIVCLAASCGFALPVATPPNAIAYGTGRLPLRNMVRAGVRMDVICTLVIVGVFYLAGDTLLRWSGLGR